MCADKTNRRSCPDCGKKVDIEKSNFCPACGKEIFTPVIDKRTNYIIIAVIAAILLLLLLLYRVLSPIIYFYLDMV
ncbi:MAG: hypothetical protein ABIH89_01975 [Elusimicrobiota bacterium]